MNLYETGGIIMNNATNKKFKKSAAIALAAALFICFALGAAAAGRSGFFSDIIRWDGAVVGTEYNQATEEIDVNVISAENGIITVSAVLLKADTVPYSMQESLGIGSYEIIDAEGNIITKGKSSKFSEIADDKAEIKISAEGIDKGDYKLVVKSFVGVKKADQPLEIHGKWECGFSIE